MRSCGHSNHQRRLLEARFLPSSTRRVELDSFVCVEAKTHQAPSCQGYDAYHNEDDFRERYQEEYGRYPYVGPRIQQSRDSAKHMTKAERDDGYVRIAVYKTWFEDTILTKYGSNALIVIPQENMTPRYRDETPRNVEQQNE